MTRRKFSLLGAGAAASALVFGAPRKLRIGIGTYSYHSLSLEAMIVQLNRLKITEIEMSRGEFMLLSHPQDELFRSTRAMLDKAGIRCVSYYAATFKEEREIGDAIRFAELLGSTNITGDASEPLLRKIDAACTQAGLSFGIHNHYFKDGFAFESAEDMLKVLANLSPTTGVTADTGHFASCGHDAAESMRKVASRLKLVHLKDVKAAGGEDNVIIGTGISKIREVMRVLHECDFRGLVAIEYEKEGPVEEDMRREVEFARSLA